MSRAGAPATAPVAVPVDMTVQSEAVATIPDAVEARGRLDALRRRLYRDGATEDDLRRYLGARDALTAAEPAPGTASAPSVAQQSGRPPAAALRPRRPALLPIVAVVAVLVALVAVAGVAATTVTARPSPAATRAADDDRSTTSPVVVGDDGGATAPENGYTTPARIAVSIDGVAAVAWQVHGHGSVYVPVDRAAASFRGGKAVVVLSSPDTVPIAWRAVRLLTRSNRSSNEQVVARSAAANRSGVPRTTVIDYDGDPPSHIAVQAQRGRGWTLLVALTPAVASDPH